MKKIFKTRVFFFALGAIIFGSIGVYATSQIYANSVDYRPSWTKSNGESIENVKDAIDELYLRSENQSSSSFTVADYASLANDEGISMTDGLVPQLTSNTGSNGTAFCNTPIYTANYDAYKAFNHNLTGNDQTNWASYVLTGNYGYIGYHFNESTYVNLFYVNSKKADNNTGVCMHTFVLQASNDGENWVDLTESIYLAPQSTKYFPITKNYGAYTYYRLYGRSNGAYSLIGLQELQLYNIQI